MDNNEWPTARFIEADVVSKLGTASRQRLYRQDDGNYIVAVGGYEKYKQGENELRNVTEYWPAGGASAPGLTPLEQYEEFKTWIEALPKVTELKKGDLVDSTEDLPDGAIVRDSYAGAYTYNAPDGGFFTPSDEGIRLASLGNPLLIWLPETEEAGE